MSHSEIQSTRLEELQKFFQWASVDLGIRDELERPEQLRGPNARFAWTACADAESSIAAGLAGTAVSARVDAARSLDDAQSPALPSAIVDLSTGARVSVEISADERLVFDRATIDAQVSREISYEAARRDSTAFVVLTSSSNADVRRIVAERVGLTRAEMNDSVNRINQRRSIDFVGRAVDSIESIGGHASPKRVAMCLGGAISTSQATEDLLARDRLAFDALVTRTATELFALPQDFVEASAGRLRAAERELVLPVRVQGLTIAAAAERCEESIETAVATAQRAVGKLHRLSRGLQAVDHEAESAIERVVARSI